MEHFYHVLDRDLIDYGVFEHGGLNLRGRPEDLDRDYVCFLGAAQTFGRFCAEPFPELVGRATNLGVVNLGTGGAGPEFFLRSDAALALANRARLVVVQVMSARSVGNRIFHPEIGGNYGFLLPGFRRTMLTRALDDLFAGRDPRGRSGRFIRDLIGETRANYVEAMLRLLAAVRRPKVLVWFAQRRPEACPDVDGLSRAFWLRRRFVLAAGLARLARFRPYAASRAGGFPHLVNPTMLDALRPAADAYVEVASRAGLPHVLRDAAGEELRRDWYYPSPEMHRLAAEALVPACLRLLNRTGPGGP
jgi:hypothetical protein